MKTTTKEYLWNGLKRTIHFVLIFIALLAILVIAKAFLPAWCYLSIVGIICLLLLVDACFVQRYSYWYVIYTFKRCDGSSGFAASYCRQEGESLNIKRFENIERENNSEIEGLIVQNALRVTKKEFEEAYKKIIKTE